MTVAGATATVSVAMLIAWQALNKLADSYDKRFSLVRQAAWTFSRRMNQRSRYFGRSLIDRYKGWGSLGRRTRTRPASP